MRVKVQTLGNGSHPKEVLVSVDTIDGKELLVVHERALQNDSLDIGYPINQLDSNFLVELPRETMTGAWRVWVPDSNVS